MLARRTTASPENTPTAEGLGSRISSLPSSAGYASKDSERGSAAETLPCAITPPLKIPGACEGTTVFLHPMERTLMPYVRSTFTTDKIVWMAYRLGEPGED